jgi:hypothetical protein
VTRHHARRDAKINGSFMRGTMFNEVRNSICGLAVCAVLAGAGMPSAAVAADADADTLTQMQQKLDQSLKMIAALTARVQQLENVQARGEALPSPDAERLQAVEQKVVQIETTNATRRSDENSLPLHGFADVGVGNRNAFNPDLKGFNVGNLDFYLTPRLGQRTLALFELNFETSINGAVGIDLERAQIGYQFSDQATVWLGRFHTPYGYVNTAMHHGAWIANALRRPAFLQFEDHGGVLPAHTVGAWLTGAERVGDGKIVYDAYAGNGQSIQGGVVDMRNAGNTDGNLVAGGRLGYQWTGGLLEGMTVGAHVFNGRIDDDQTPIDRTQLRMYGGYAVYDTDRWENIAEFYQFDNEDLSGNTGKHRSEAGFVQLAYRASWGVPYVRYERAVLKQTDPYFAQQNSGASYYRNAFGLRFDIDLKSALKLELAETHLTDRAPRQYNEALVDYAIRF